MSEKLGQTPDTTRPPVPPAAPVVGYECGMSGGRDQREPMERLVRLATVLHHAGRAGVDSTRLIEIAGFADGKDPGSQLIRELRHLRNLGWQIDSIGEEGETGRYRMTTVDNRVRVSLDPTEQTALRRAVLMTDRGDLADRLGLHSDEAAPAVDLPVSLPTEEGDEALTMAISAVRRRARLRFRYGGRDRLVHAASVRVQNTTWYLTGAEEGDDLVKSFVVSRMSEVSLDAAGSADPPALTRHPELHPMSWEIDPPVEVTVRCPTEFAPDVRRWLGDPLSCDESGPDTLLTFRVTNRSALRSRIYQLGTRVRVVGPDEVRRELLDELTAMAGE